MTKDQGKPSKSSKFQLFRLAQNVDKKALCMNRVIPVLVLSILLGCKRSSDFENLFSSLSTGVPQFQKIENFSRPTDAGKGDFFSVDFTQSPEQFHGFISKLGTTETDVLSTKGALHVKVNSKINPKYPWFLEVKADTTEAGEKMIHVHVEGRQIYE
jgi:hypothetical protein